MGAERGHTDFEASCQLEHKGWTGEVCFQLEEVVQLAIEAWAVESTVGLQVMGHIYSMEEVLLVVHCKEMGLEESWVLERDVRIAAQVSLADERID